MGLLFFELFSISKAININNAINLYDRIPTPDLFSEGFKNFEIQLVARIRINKIVKVSKGS